MSEDERYKGRSFEDMARHLAGFVSALLSSVNTPEIYASIMASEHTSILMSILIAFDDKAPFVKKSLQTQLSLVGKLLEFVKNNPEASRSEKLDFIVPIFEAEIEKIKKMIKEGEELPKAPTGEEFDKEFLKDLKIRMPESNTGNC